MATNEPKPVTPLPFIDALLGYQKTAALKAAIELGVFDAIGAHGADVEAVCAKTNTSAHGARILCDYLTVLGFLEKSGTIWRQTPITTTFIDSRSPSSMASVVRFLAGPELLATDAGTMGEAAMTAPPITTLRWTSASAASVIARTCDRNPSAEPSSISLWSYL